MEFRSKSWSICLALLRVNPSRARVAECRWTALPPHYLASYNPSYSWQFCGHSSGASEYLSARPSDPTRAVLNEDSGLAYEGLIMRNFRAAAEHSGSSWFRIRDSVHLLLEILALLLCMFTSFPASSQSNAKTVLILYSFTDRSLFGPVDLLESSIRARVPWPVDFYVESFESQRFENEEYEKSVAETLKHAYGGRKPDLVMVAAYPALQFALKHRDELFPGVPIVFFAVEVRRLAGQKLWPGVTGVTDTVDFQATIDLALSLHPATHTIAIITTNSAF